MEAVKNIGAIVLKEIEKRGEGLLEGFTEDPSDNGKYPNCIQIVFHRIDGKIQYKQVRAVQYDSDYKLKYLYRKGTSRGTDLTPTCKITEIDRTYVIKLLACYKESLGFDKEKYENEINEIRDIYYILESNKDNIIADIKEKTKGLPKKENAFLTVVFEDDKNIKYIGDYLLFRDKIVNDALKKFHYSATYKDIYAEKGVCCICRKYENDIFGLVGVVFPFYTIDKPGYVSGLLYEKAWKNYPVCKNCAILIELGKKYLDDNLRMPFYGREYYLIPKPIYETDLEDVLKRYKTLKHVSEDNLESIYSTVEEKVMDFLGRQENNISFDLMFTENNKSALTIELNIEDVAPSRFKSIYDAINRIRNMEFFSDKPVGFGMLVRLFPRKTHNRYFLECIDKIISNRIIEYNFLMQFFNSYLIDSFKKEEAGQLEKGEDNYRYATFRIFGFIYFLQYMKLLNCQEEVDDMKIEKKEWNIKDYSSKEELFEDFFQSARPFFDTSERKAVFMVGYLAKELLNWQASKEGGRKPFMAKLKGLQLDGKDIQRLIPQIQNKFAEYKIDYYSEELSIASRYMIESENLKNMAKLDIPYYFSLGMNMEKYIITSNKKENDKVTDGEGSF